MNISLGNGSSGRRKQWLLAAGLATSLGLGALTWQGLPGVSLATGQETVALKSEGSVPQGVQQAENLSQAFRNAAEEAIPTVVTIKTRKSASVQRGNRNNPELREKMREQLREQFGSDEELQRRFGNNNPFGRSLEDFLDQFDQAPNLQVPEQTGVGSGVIIDKSGVILTNRHVVAGADEVSVRLSDGREFKATDIATDDGSDLAVLRIQANSELPSARLGNAEKLGIGDWVIAVGTPFELDSTVSAGIISGKGRVLGAGGRTSYLQTDAAINPGNSGGPLINLDGEVVGINTAIASNSGGYQGIGFAIPINQAKWVADQLVKTGSVQRAFLGIMIEELSPAVAQQLDTTPNAGALVTEVMPESPARAAGVQEGDIVTGFAGKQVRKPRELQEIVERANLDKKHELTVVRDGEPVTLEVSLKAMPSIAARGAKENSTKEEQVESSATHSELGLDLEPLEAERAEAMNIPGGNGLLVTNTESGGPAAKSGLQPGMVILKVGKTRVSTVEEFTAAVAKESLEDGVLLLVREGQGSHFLVLKK